MTETAEPRTVPVPPADRRRSRERLALPVLLTGVCLIVLDFFIVNVALPAVQTDLGASQSALEWVVAGYAVTFAVFLITASRAGDRLGRRRVFRAGVAVFTLASAACGLAPSTEVLVAARLVQGAGAAMISPTVLAIIGVLYAGEARNRAIGTYATVMGGAAASGQLVGGLLLHADVAGLGWRTVFLVNVPVGLVALLGARAVPESTSPDPAHLDLVSLGLLMLAVLALVLPLVEGRAAGWPAWTFVSLAAVPALAVGLAARQRAVVRAGGTPLLAPELLRRRHVSAGLLTQLAFWTGQASYFFVLAVYLQLGRGQSALQSGLVFTFVAGSYVVASGRAPRLLARFGRSLVVGGAGLLGVGHLAVLVAVHEIGTTGSVLWLAPGLVCAGAGMGLCLAPIAATVLGTMEPQHLGSMSGVLATVQNIGNALGVALVGLVFYGLQDHGLGTAFGWSLAGLAALMVVVAASAWLLPGRHEPSRPGVVS